MRSLILSLALVAPVHALQSFSVAASGDFSRVRYGELVTRLVEADGRERPAVLRYVVHTPIGTPRALVVLLPDGHGLVGDKVTGRVLSTPEDYLYEQAPLFAELGFLALVVDRTSAEEALNDRAHDLFRLTPAHGQDLATVIRAENREGLDVFFVGAGRGSLSAVSQHKLARAIALFQPVTSGPGPVLGGSEHPSLQPSSVTVPVHVMAELGSSSAVTSPRHALDLELDFLLAGVPAAFSLLDADPVDLGPAAGTAVEGHFRLPASDAVDTRAVAKITRFLGLVQLWDQGANPDNEAPLAGGTTVRSGDGASVTIDLSTLALDPDGDTLEFALPHALSSRGAALSLEEGRVTYVPAQTGITDGFVFGVTDGKGAWVHELVVVVVD